MRGETFFSLSLFRFPSAGFSPPPSLLFPLSSLSLRFPKRHEKKYTKEKKRFLPFLFLTYPPSKGSSLERGTKAERKRRGGEQQLLAGSLRTERGSSLGGEDCGGGAGGTERRWGPSSRAAPFCWIAVEGGKGTWLARPREGGGGEIDAVYVTLIFFSLQKCFHAAKRSANYLTFSKSFSVVLIVACLGLLEYLLMGQAACYVSA